MPPFLNLSQANVLSAYMWGVRVDRVTATLPQTASAPIFNVLGGRVMVNLIIGTVTTIIQAQANLTKLTAVPSIGSAVDMCATVDITGLEVGGMLIPNGVLATALGKTLGGVGVSTLNPYILPIGTINLNTGSSSTGAIKWSIFYNSLDDNATVTPA